MRDFTSEQLASLFKVHPLRLKRWAREWLGVDEEAGRQMGKARRFDLDKGFLLFIGREMLTGLHVPSDRVGKVLEALEPWLRKKGLLPNMRGFMKNPKDPVEWYNWHIEILECGDEYKVRAMGVLEWSDKDKLPSTGQKVIGTRFIREEIGGEITFGRHIFSPWRTTRLHVASLLWAFLTLADPGSTVEEEYRRNEEFEEHLRELRQEGKLREPGEEKRLRELHEIEGLQKLEEKAFWTRWCENTGRDYIQTPGEYGFRRER